MSSSRFALSQVARLKRIGRGDPWCVECRDWHPAGKHRKAGLVNIDGHPIRPRPKVTDEQRLGRWMRKVDKNGPLPAAWSPARDGGPCWIWLGACDKQGYGHVGRSSGGKRRWQRAHRAIYEMVVGPIPGGLELDHLCRVKRCVNPAHLEPVTRSVNLKRGNVGGLRSRGLPAENAAKTHCKHGHPFDEANTRRVGGTRQCRACDRAASRAYKQRKTAAIEPVRKPGRAA